MTNFDFNTGNRAFVFTSFAQLTDFVFFPVSSRWYFRVKPARISRHTLRRPSTRRWSGCSLPAESWPNPPSTKTARWRGPALETIMKARVGLSFPGGILRNDVLDQNRMTQNFLRFAELFHICLLTIRKYIFVAFQTRKKKAHCFRNRKIFCGPKRQNCFSCNICNKTNALFQEINPRTSLTHWVCCAGAVVKHLPRMKALVLNAVVAGSSCSTMTFASSLSTFLSNKGCLKTT